MVVCLGGTVAMARQPTTEVRWLSFREFTADVELRYEAEERDRRQKSSTARTRYRQRSFHEIFELAWRGYVYHPRFLDFTAAFGFDVEQTQVDIDSVAKSTSVTHQVASPLHSISGVFFSQHPVSLSFGLERRRSTATRGFGELSIIDTESQRVGLRLKSSVLPTRIFFSRTRTDQDQSGIGQDRRDEFTSAGFATDYYGERRTSRLSYEHTDSTEEVTNVFGDSVSRFVTARKVNDVTLTDHLRLGDQGSSRLDSTVLFRDDAGTFPSRRFQISESLHLGHSKSLSTDYGLRFSRDEIGDSIADVVSGEASLTHRLYESLITRLELRGSQESFGGSTRSIRGSSLSLSYRNRIPHGTLFIDLGLGRQLTDEAGGGTMRAVVDESHVLDDATTVVLDNIDVVEPSIRVTDATGAITYFRDIDYRVVVRARFVELRRMTSGHIANGQTVLVNYSYEIGAPISYATSRQRCRVQLDLFDHLSVYASRSTTEQDLRSGIDDGRLQDIVDTLYGARLTVGPATLTAERQDYDSTLAPFVSDMVSLDVRQTLARIHTVGLIALQRHVTFDQGDDSSSRSISATYQVSPRHLPSLKVTAGYEQQDDRGFQGDYTFARIEALYRIHATEIAATLWFRERDDQFANELNNYFFLSIRRRF